MINRIFTSIIIVILTASLIPVSISIFNNNNDDSCYPVPNLVLPAYAWSYYYNSTNHRWYNHTQTSDTIYNELAIHDFNDLSGNGSPPNPNYHSMGLWIQNNNDTGLVGQHLSEIDILLSGSPNTVHVPIYGGVIYATGASNGLLKTQIGSIVYADDIDSVSARYVNFTTNTPVTISMNTSIGIFINQTDSIESVNTYSIYDNDNDDWSGGTCFSDGMGLYETFQRDGGSMQDNSGNPTGRNLSMILKTTEDTYTLIPLSNNSFSQTVEGRQICQTEFDLLAILVVFVIIGILLYLLNANRKNNKK